MKTTIYINKEETKATAVTVFGINTSSMTSRESIYTLKGGRFISDLEDVINTYKGAEIIREN